MKKGYKCVVEQNGSAFTAVKGFKAAGVACDIRGKGDLSRLDLALIVSDVPAAAAGVFTTNDVKSAPVLVDSEHLAKARTARAIVAYSGVANACTGKRGISDAEKSCAAVSKRLGVSADEVLVCSTGRIGDFLPMDKIMGGIDKAFGSLKSEDGSFMDGARAIMTTDTHSKTVVARVTGSFGSFSIAGMAKGAGMIEPNMATMLAFFISDAKVPKALLKSSLKWAADRSFNRISVDGDMSTNDTVICLCNGQSGVSAASGEALEAFKEALLGVSRALAKMIVADGEETTRVIEVEVSGAKTRAQAEKICRSVANSMLVKCAWFGGDPNWGRIADAVGYARTGVDFDKMDLSYDNVAVLRKGVVKTANADKWRKVVAGKSFSVRINLNSGDASDSVLTADLTEGYVAFNKGE